MTMDTFNGHKPSSTTPNSSQRLLPRQTTCQPQPQNMPSQIKALFFILGPFLIVITTYVVWQSNLPLVSPIALIDVITGHSIASKSPKIIYGFFPYWNSKYANELNINFLTHLAYFAIDLNPDGTINKTNLKKEQEPGWNKLNSNTIEKLLYQSK